MTTPPGPRTTAPAAIPTLSTSMANAVGPALRTARGMRQDAGTRTSARATSGTGSRGSALGEIRLVEINESDDLYEVWRGRKPVLHVPDSESYCRQRIRQIRKDERVTFEGENGRRLDITKQFEKAPRLRR